MKRLVFLLGAITGALAMHAWREYRAALELAELAGLGHYPPAPALDPEEIDKLVREAEEHLQSVRDFSINADELQAMLDTFSSGPMLAEKRETLRRRTVPDLDMVWRGDIAGTRQRAELWLGQQPESSWDEVLPRLTKVLWFARSGPVWGAWMTARNSAERSADLVAYLHGTWYLFPNVPSDQWHLAGSQGDIHEKDTRSL